MTRLCTSQVAGIPFALESLDRSLRAATGEDLQTLAARAAGWTPAEAARKASGTPAAVVPVSAGAGLIRAFPEAVAAVLNHLGFRAWVTAQPDVAGFAAAFQEGAEVLFAADDEAFVAFHLPSRAVAENGAATARGFIEALSAAAALRGRSLAGEQVLVLGLGPVGRECLRALLKRHAEVRIYDRDPRRTAACLEAHPGIRTSAPLSAALASADCIVDATPAEGLIDAGVLRPTALVAAPGVPHGLTAAAADELGDRFIHDVLALGVSVMAYECLPKASETPFVQGVEKCPDARRANPEERDLQTGTSQ